MAHVRIAAKNSFYLFLESGITRIIEFFVFVWLSRYLSQDQFGQYNFVIAYLTLFAVVADFGMISIVQREIARDDSLSPQLLGVGLTYAGCFSIILMVLSYLFFLMIRSHFGYSFEMTTILLIATPLILFSAKIKSFRKMWEIMYVVHFKIKYIAWFNILGRVLFLSSLWLIISYNGSFYYIIIAMALCDLPGFIGIALWSMKLFPRPRFSFNFTQFSNIFRKSYPVLLSAVFYIIKLNIAIVAIEFYLTSDQVALFSAAWKIPSAFVIVPAVMNMVLMPILAKKYVENYDAFLNVFGIPIKFLAIVALPLMLYIYFYMDNIIVFLFQERYLAAVVPAQIMTFALLFMFISVFFDSMLIACDKQMYSLLFEVISGSLFLILNFVLIPVYGIIGASIAVIYSYASIVLLGLLFSQTRKMMVVVLKKIFKPIIASAGIIFVLFGLSLNVFITIPFGLLLYFGLLIAGKSFDKNDREVLSELIGK